MPENRQPLFMGIGPVWLHCYDIYLDPQNADNKRPTEIRTLQLRHGRYYVNRSTYIFWIFTSECTALEKKNIISHCRFQGDTVFFSGEAGPQSTYSSCEQETFISMYS